jgi:hypothetical protein
MVAGRLDELVQNDAALLLLGGPIPFAQSCQVVLGGLGIAHGKVSFG